MSQPTPQQADQIQQEMRQVRAELRQDVQELVANARVMADWQHYVRSYPWVFVGVAAGLGFLLVPSRSQVIRADAKSLMDLAKHDKLVVKVQSQQPQQRHGLVGSLARMAASSLLQGGMAFVSQQVGQMAEAFRHAPPPRREGDGQP